MHSPDAINSILVTHINSEYTSSRMFVHDSVGHAYLMADNNREFGRALPGEFHSLIQKLLAASIYIHLYIYTTLFLDIFISFIGSNYPVWSFGMNLGNYR